MLKIMIDYKTENPQTLKEMLRLAVHPLFQGASAVCAG